MPAVIALIAELYKLGVGTDVVNLVETIKGYVTASGGTITPADLTILDGYKNETWAQHIAQAQSELNPSTPPVATS